MSSTLSCKYADIIYWRSLSSSREAGEGNGTAASRPVTYVPRLNIDWPNKFRPVDEPHCGYDGSKCKRPGGRTEVAAGVLGALLFMAIVLTLSMYRRWKIEQEIEGLLWKINPECLQGYRGLMQPCTSRQSLGSVMSGESRGYGATCQTARYRGSIVRVKELHYEKKKDIPRSVMKEMKQMREMRHDNINRRVLPLTDSKTLHIWYPFIFPATALCNQQVLYAVSSAPASSRTASSS